jgi:hypothetical protein
MEIFIFDESTSDLQEALDVHARGGKVLCSKCGAELIIAANRAEANKHRISPGIVCPANNRHIERAFSLEEDFVAFDQWYQGMKSKMKTLEDK